MARLYMRRCNGDVPAVLVEDNSLGAIVAPLLAGRYTVHSEAANVVAALVDLDVGGLAMIQRLRAEHGALPVIALTNELGREVVLGALAAGASGLLTKNRIEVELADALDAVRAGGTPLSPSVASHVVSALRGTSSHQVPPPAPTLTQAEQRVLEQLARGLTYEQVGLVLDITINTVRTRVRALYEKLGAMSRTEAVVNAARIGLIRIDG